jgi:putative endonuclease
MYYVYLLKCADGTIYTGITTDVQRRFEEHKGGKGAHYTRVKKAVKILYTEEHADRSSASKREAEIKKLTRNQKLDLVRARDTITP